MSKTQIFEVIKRSEVIKKPGIYQVYKEKNYLVNYKSRLFSHKINSENFQH